ncbi:hypothetical protein M0802_000214 [Mischocyttarus mexicanus]|nr:hypothetical protein M0802_000214 [Mischocyttarus mexicanus]
MGVRLAGPDGVVKNHTRRIIHEEEGSNKGYVVRVSTLIVVPLVLLLAFLDPRYRPPSSKSFYRAYSSSYFSLLIRSRKLDQAGIDGVGEHRGQHCLPQSERR